MQPASAQTEPGHGGTDSRKVPCARCGRENAVAARICVGCGAELANAPGPKGMLPDALADPVAFKPLPPRDPQFFLRATVASGVVLAVLAGGAYFLYKNFFLADFSPAYTRRMPASDERKEAAAGPAAAGRVAPPAVMQTPAPRTATPAPQAAKPSLPQETLVSAPRAAVPSTAAPRSAPALSKSPGKSPPPRAAVKPAAAATAKPADIAVGSCTEALAAIGLCAAAAPPQGRVRAPAEIAPASAPLPRTTPCEASVAALGLCAPATNPRKE